MIKREWLLGVGLLSGGIGVSMNAVPAWAQNDGTIGAVAAVKPDAFGTAPAAAEQTLAIGNGVVQNEKIRTNPAGTANLIFADQSTLTVGKGSEVTLDKFVYDPGSKAGGMALSLAQGTLRFVGGQLAKNGAVQVKTPTATLTVRGAIAIFGPDFALLVYGDSLTDEGSGLTVHRPGFMITFKNGQPQIEKITDAQLGEILKTFNPDTGIGGKLPDEELALLESELGDDRIAELIGDIRQQIDQLTQRGNPALDSLRTVIVPTTASS